jgi:FkbM family methyltransferase
MPRAPGPRLAAPCLRLAQLVRALPGFRGRDRILISLLGPVLRRPGTLRGEYGGGLRFEGDPSVDANLGYMLLLRHARPALAPVLDATLELGSVFADVGANLGLYTLWAARRVSTQGRVHAFEPVPDVRERLRCNVALNAFDQVEIVASAVGAEPGRVTLNRVAGASGRTSRYVHPEAGSIEAPVVALDAYFRGRRPPDLLKIDVEGMELDVLLGARELLASESAPAIVFEAGAELLAAAGTPYAELLALLERQGGYRTFALTPRGLRREPEGAAVAGSPNVLSLRPDLAAHERVRERLARQRFDANQNG